MKIIVKNLQKKINLDPFRIKRAVHKIKVPAKFDTLELSMYFVKNSVIKRLNRQFFARNCLTDVISFKLDDDCAEVFIAPMVVKNNAYNFKVVFKEELYRCIVHGILHVFGFKDGKKSNKAKMWKRQEALLKSLI
ncbi:rRNA maturation RNase YbeY [Candidatus Omnitrophota bacterium]